jgi:hypothetical protein
VLAANPLCEEVGDLSMTWNSFRMARLRVLSKCVLFPTLSNTQPCGEDAGGVPRASSDYDEFLLGVGRQST